MLLKVKLDSRVKGSWFGVRPKAIWSCALKVRKGTVASGWTKSHAASVPELSLWSRNGDAGRDLFSEFH